MSTNIKKVKTKPGEDIQTQNLSCSKDLESEASSSQLQKPTIVIDSEEESVDTLPIFFTTDKPHTSETVSSSSKTESSSPETVDYDSKKRIYECDLCDKAFYQSSDLRKHYLVHTGEKNFLCDVCNKAFRQVSHLKHHKLIHSNEKPYKCDKCQKAFRNSGILHKHRLVHSGQRDHVCDVCKKAFSQAAHLKTHKLSHTGQKNHVCEVCNWAFAEAGNLRKHKLTHVKQKTEKKTCNSKQNDKCINSS